MTTELTPEHLTQLKIYADKWSHISLSTEPANHIEAEKGVHIAYKLAGLEPPNVIWFQSPAELFTSPLIAEYEGTELYTNIHESIRQLKSQVYQATENTLLSHMIKIVDMIPGEIYLIKRLLDELLQDYIIDNSPSPLTTYTDAFTQYSYDGQHNPRLLAHYDYLLQEHLPEFGANPLFREIKLAQQVGYWLMYEDTCFLSERHNILHIDNQQQLHCEDGQAIGYPDGWGTYVWHGVHVPEYVIMRPQDITPDKIMSEPNTEVSRVMLERYGLANFIRDGGFSIVQSDDYGDLYRVEFKNGDEPIVAVHVQDASTDRDYFLYVPPHIRTAHQGVAWTFGYDNESDYNPDRET